MVKQKMNRNKPILLLLATFSLNLAFAQIVRGPVPIDPEIIAKTHRAQAATVRGEEFLKNKQFDKAIEAFREAVRIEDTLGYFTSGGNYDLAEALITAGRPKEALVAYKKAIRWDPVRKELDINGPPAINISMDYAMLLAKSGKEDEAKAIYYYGLRYFNWDAEDVFEPFPFLVVFDLDDDPNATVWEYSQENLEAAATMAKASYRGWDLDSMLVKVRKLQPTWVLPIMIQYTRSDEGAQKSDVKKLAEALAKNDTERAWIKAFLKGENLAKVGLAMRKSSSVLNKARADLETTHDQVAIVYKKEG
jgi:tetratricopeptide (TPR) repeat protein